MSQLNEGRFQNQTQWMSGKGLKTNICEPVTLFWRELRGDCFVELLPNTLLEVHAEYIHVQVLVKAHFI